MVKINLKFSTKSALNRLRYPGSRNAKVTFSSIGKTCLRQLWYGFHWASPPKEIPSVLHRTFGVGHSFEAIAIKQLRQIGIRVYKVDENGLQVDIYGDEPKDFKQEVLRGRTGHEKGKPDGRCTGVLEAPKTEHVLELKTSKDKYWKLVDKHGVKFAEPEHYAQCQREMHAMKLTRTLYINVNKDTSELYVERINYDESFAKSLERKEIFIITAQEPPERAWDKGDFNCEYCPQKEVCDGEVLPEKNCRTCRFVDIENDGKWFCTNGNTAGERSYDQQIEGCNKHEYGFELLSSE